MDKSALFAYHSPSLHRTRDNSSTLFASVLAVVGRFPAPRIPSRLVVITLVIAGALCAAGPARAQLPSRSMVSRSTAIFLGVVRTTSSRLDEAKRMIVTDTTFDVARYVKGDLGPSVTVTEPGGFLPERNLMMRAPGFPTFEVGETRIIFVWTDPEGLYRVLGGTSGAFVVTTDGNTGAQQAGGMPLDDFLRSIATATRD